VADAEVVLSERTIVSTNTINLQEQLVTKDLPFLRRALDLPFRFALVKGRGNYISIRRAKLAMDTGLALVDGPEAKQLAALDEWLKVTRDGSLQDLPFTPSAEVWDEVASESDVCLRTRCPHFEQCFYQRARRDATTADVLVVNQDGLFHNAGHILGSAQVRDGSLVSLIWPATSCTARLRRS
jgi:ATP-dependent DNA helicase DinG